MAGIHGRAFWPGASNCDGCTYTMSHGISPGIAVFRMSPNLDGSLPSEYGDLVFDDGQTKIVIPDAHLRGIKSSTDGSGTSWSLEIADRRWAWGELGAVNGMYNQLDPFGKLIPWTTRSPRELATLLLMAMGESKYEIDLPDGITRAQGAAFARILRPGENFPPSGTNPCFNWEAEPPAQALQRLCDIFGRRVIYQLSTNSVLIAIPGRGRSLPTGLSASRHAPSINAPDRPSGIGVIGSPTRVQMRLLIEPVGKEWDGTYRPIDELSYAPTVGGAFQISTATFTSFSDAVTSYKVYVNDIIIAGYTDPGDTAATMTTKLAAAANKNPDVAKVAVATAAGGVLTLKGKKAGEAFGFRTEVYPAPTVHESKTVQVAQPPGRSWANIAPPTFSPNQLTETDRLTMYDAQKLAQESVWKCYRITAIDPSSAKDGPFKQLVAPGYGIINRRQQILLTDTSVEQVTPQPGDPELKDNRGQPITIDLYNGYSRDKPAVVYGSAVQLATFAYKLPKPTNTREGERYFAQFSIEPFEQLVVFSDHVYFFDNGQYQKPRLVLETGCMIRNNESNQLECYVTTKPLADGAPNTNFLIKKYPDVQLNIVGNYDEKHNLLFTTKLEEDAIIRAKFYLDGLALQFPTAEAMTEDYNGFVAIDLDGAIGQITWETDQSGCHTVASANSEHNIWIPPYPARRRAEGLPSISVQRIGDAIAKATNAVVSGLDGIFTGGR
jgi:hypothetical protein